MRNPFQRLRSLPWVPLLLVAAMTLVILFGIEMALDILVQMPVFARVLQLLFTPPLGLLMMVAVGLGTGALSVWLLETIRPDVFINSGVLWALVGCLILLTFVRQILLAYIQTFLPFVPLISTDQISLMGMLVGVFLGGRRYWR